MNFITQHLPKRKETSEKLNNSKLVSILALWKKKKRKKKIKEKQTFTEN